MARILVVDDEVGIRELLSEILYDEGHTVELAENASEARAARLAFRPDLVLLDIWMPDTDGVSLLKEWSGQGLLDMPVVMMSGHATIDTAVEATRIGAADFLEKPITMQKLLKTVENCLKLGRLATASGRVAATAAPAKTSVAPVVTASTTSATTPAAATAATATTTTASAATTAPSQSTSATQAQGTVEAQTTAPAALAPDDHIRTGRLGCVSLDIPLREARDDFERAYFEYHIEQEGGSMTRISERTGLERTHLYRKLRQLGVDTARKRNA